MVKQRHNSEFEELSLEYQISNINQAKNFALYLDALGCFYTDRPVDYEMVTSSDYAALPLEEREKDYEPFNSMLKLVKRFDGLRIYKLD